MARYPELRLTCHEAQDNALLGFLRARPREVGEGLRTNPRHDSTARARLLWKDGESDRVVAARMLNVCRTGAALLVATPPPGSAAVMVRVMGEEPTPWIEARVVGVDAVDGRRSRVRLRFLEFCPNLFLKAAVLAGMAAPEAEAPGDETAP